MELEACPTQWFSYNTFFGAGTSDNASNTLTMGVQGSGWINCDIGAGYNGVCTQLPVNTKRLITFSGTRVVVSDGKTYNIGRTVGTCTYSLALFTRHLSSGFTSEIGKARIYSCKIWSGVHEDHDNSTLLMHLIPVADYDGKPCMYDSVSERMLYNGGSGSFVVGPTKE